MKKYKEENTLISVNSRRERESEYRKKIITIEINNVITCLFVISFFVEQIEIRAKA